MPREESSVSALAIVALVAAGFAALGAEEASESKAEAVVARPLAIAPGSEIGFRMRPASATGIAFENRLSSAAMVDNEVLLDGSGVALGDFDGDGLLDMFFAGLESDCALYRNLGDWRFADVTAAAGVALAGKMAAGAVFADVDGDRDLDLLVTTYEHGNFLFAGDGKGGFVDRTDAAGLGGAPGGGTTMALADVDHDGDLDLYIACYRVRKVKDSGIPMQLRMEDGKIVIPEELAEHLEMRDGRIRALGMVDRFYVNDGAGRFALVDFAEGRFMDAAGAPLIAPRDWGLSAAFRDVNDDGHADLYVCNDFWTPDRFYLGDGKGRFRELGLPQLAKTSFSSMGVAFGDLDLDGDEDALVVDMRSPDRRLRMTQMTARDPQDVTPGAPLARSEVDHNVLLAARGDGSYAEIAQAAGIDASYWSWSALLIDVDLDGLEDVLIGSGHAHDPSDFDGVETLRARAKEAQISPEEFKAALITYPRLAPPNQAFSNLGDMRFAECGEQWGFASRGITHGIASGDLDGDGDLDVVCNVLGAPTEIYENIGAGSRIAVRLIGKSPNTAAIGAKVWLMVDGLATQSRQIEAGGSYLSGRDSLVVLAVPVRSVDASPLKLSIDVRWPGGQWNSVKGVQANHLYSLDEGAMAMAHDEFRPMQPMPISEGSRASMDAPRFLDDFSGVGLFHDESAALGHMHQEKHFDDFLLQPLLPWRTSREGPGVAICDLDGDGADEVVIGAGAGGEIAVFTASAASKGEFTFTRVAASAGAGASARDQPALALWWHEGRPVLIAAQPSLEDGDAAAPSAVGYCMESGKVVGFGSLAGVEASVGVLAVADADGDGDLDVFAAGRQIPGRYGAAPGSRIYWNQGGALVAGAEESQLLATLPMVTGAIFTDLDGDGRTELALACEWEGVRILGFVDGQWRDLTTRYGFAERHDAARGITAADLDGDGKMDLVVTSWGLNLDHAPGDGWIRELYQGDLDQNGRHDIVEAMTDSRTGQSWPLRNRAHAIAQIPALAQRAPTHARYAELTLVELYSAAGLARAERHAISSTAHVVYLNRGAAFERRELSYAAQWSAASGVAAADLDGDGDTDLFLAQNYFAVRPEEGRLDAGTGALLVNDGAGNFRVLDVRESGVAIQEETRGVAAGDLDGDGRVDLVVGAPGAATRVLRNVMARPGLRIRLAGPPGNPAGVGAVVRLQKGAWSGAAREVHAAAGHGSVDSLALVLSEPADLPLQDAALHILVRWPGGGETRTVVAPGARAIVIPWQ